ncbi:hypothetical protein [Cerasicoccus frondis]|uniref:hypothetical protein n=1 Tax=Cerasicoccus frondis TaxID=490090 RepID=UPI002852D4C7|nr:hypothetical protein [Cerasicoccus frondis]
MENFLTFYPRDKLCSTQEPWHELKALIFGFSEIFSIAKSHSGACEEDRLMKLLKAPLSIAPTLVEALPSAVRVNWDEETPHAASRWLWHELLALPGFLSDSLELATMLGLRVSALERVISAFVDTEYKGIFATDARKRWWTSEVRPTVERILGHAVSRPLYHYREELLRRCGNSRVLPTWYSKAHGRGGDELIPDVVAYIDEEREEDKRVQCLFKDTVVDARDSNPDFGFRPRLIYNGVSED